MFYFDPMNSLVFPVIDSTLSAAHLGAWITDRFHLPDVRCSLIKTTMNHSYLVRTHEEQYILRVYNQRYRRPAQVQQELSFLSSLKGKVNVSLPVPDTEGTLLHELQAPEGTRCAVLFSFAEGRKQRYLTPELNYSIGAEVGRLHLWTQNKSIDRTQYDISRLVEWAYQEAVKYIPAEPEEMQWFKGRAAVLSELFDRHPLRTGVVHLDIWYDNMTIGDDGRITLIDFDNCGNGWLILDIGYYLMQLYHTEPDKSAYEQKKTSFIEGYRSVTPVSDQELELVPYAGLAIWLYYLGLQAERFDYFANFFLSENYAKMYIGMVRGWMKYNKC
jgi:Ser/Thr protein kinase RdoA (MazF antagonist)